MDKLKKLYIILFSSIFVLTGCSTININDLDDDKTTDTTINQPSEDEETDKDEEVSNIKQVEFNISSIDANTDEKIVIGKLKLDENKSIEEKLNLLIIEISKLQFNNAPIKLLKVENNIAYVDLQEGKEQNYWSEGYFQGSTGGNITTYTLTESLLQRDYKGMWIDGVQFSYEGKTDIEFDHIGLEFFGNMIKR